MAHLNIGGRFDEGRSAAQTKGLEFKCPALDRAAAFLKRNGTHHLIASVGLRIDVTEVDRPAGKLRPQIFPP